MPDPHRAKRLEEAYKWLRAGQPMMLVFDDTPLVLQDLDRRLLSLELPEHPEAGQDDQEGVSP